MSIFKVEDIYNLTPSGGNDILSIYERILFVADIENYTPCKDDILIWFFDDRLADNLSERTSNVVIQPYEDINTAGVTHVFQSPGIYKIRTFLKSKDFIYEKSFFHSVLGETPIVIAQSTDGIQIIGLDSYATIWYTTDGTTPKKFTVPSNPVWSASGSYVVDDLVNHLYSNYYRCIRDTSSTTSPLDNTSDWQRTNIKKYTTNELINENINELQTLKVVAYTYDYQTFETTTTILYTPLFVTYSVTGDQILIPEIDTNPVTATWPVTATFNVNRDATIYYSINSSAASAYSTPLVLTESCTLTTYAMDTNSVSSIPKDLEFNFLNNPSITATVIEDQLTFDSDIPVRIYYTYGSTPTTASNIYVSPIVSAGATIKYIYKDIYNRTGSGADIAIP
jgi:hypothetical protein